MISYIVMLALCILGVIFLLNLLILKISSWREENIVLTLPLYSEDDDIIYHIENIKQFADLFCVKKECKVVVINYGAPEWFCKKIAERYKNCGFLSIVSSETSSTEMLNSVFTPY